MQWEEPSSGRPPAKRARRVFDTQDCSDDPLARTKNEKTILKSCLKRSTEPYSSTEARSDRSSNDEPKQKTEGTPCKLSGVSSLRPSPGIGTNGKAMVLPVEEGNLGIGMRRVDAKETPYSYDFANRKSNGAPSVKPFSETRVEGKAGNDEAKQNIDDTPRKLIYASSLRPSPGGTNGNSTVFPAGEGNLGMRNVGTKKTPSSSDLANRKSNGAPSVKPFSETRLEGRPAASKHVGDHNRKNKNQENKIIDLTSSCSENTHCIFAIDFSKSMRETDVKTSSGKISRWEAVFECVDSFLTQQLQQQKESNLMSTCLVSVLIFNDSSRIILKRMKLTGEGSDIRTRLNSAKKKLEPQGGTGFAAGFKEAEQLARFNVNDKIIMVFLSDGRPGDLCPKPPRPTSAMQTTFRRNSAMFPVAGYYISKMQERHINFSLQLICLYTEGVKVSIIVVLYTIVLSHLGV